MTDNEVATASGAVDRLTGLVEAAEGDRRARRRLLDRASRVLAADAEAERRSRSAVAEAERRARSVEADAEARIRAAEARIRVQERERAASRAEREAGRAEQAAEREARAETVSLRRARWSHRREVAGAAAPATLSMLVYLAAVASAVFGQVSVATGRYGWSMFRALLLAGFIELMALAMATTANWLRLRGERASAPRVLTWIFASFAASVNIWGHINDPLMATGLGAASLGGITLWEIRSSARHRDALRRVGQLGEPLPPLGLRFWVLQPAVAVAAYRVGVRTRVSPAAAPLVAQAEAERALRREARRIRGSRRRSLWIAAAFASGLGTAVLGTMTLPARGQSQPLWWLGGSAVAAVVFAIGALTGRRPDRQADVYPGRRLPDTPRPAPVGTGPAPAGTPEPTRAGVAAPAPGPAAVTASAPAASGATASASADTPGLPPTVSPTRMAAFTTASAVRTARAPGLDPRERAAVPEQRPPALAAAAPISPAGTPGVFSDTGEFRALTAPEHYERDAPGGESQGLAPAPGHTTAEAPDQTAAAGPTHQSISRRAAAKRNGIPDEAREWIAECLQAERAPTGPEIGRRYRVDASTGRRWVRQVRDTLGAETL